MGCIELCQDIDSRRGGGQCLIHGIAFNDPVSVNN